MPDVLWSLAVVSGFIIGMGSQTNSVAQVNTHVYFASQQRSTVAAAQKVVNSKNQGRACTLLQRRNFLEGMEQSPEYQKAVLLVRAGLATKSAGTSFDQPVTIFRYKGATPESAGRGVFIPDGNALLFCFGRWTVTAVKPTSIFQAQPGYQAVEAIIELTDAVSWVNSTPNTSVLTTPNGGSDVSGFRAANQYDKPTDMSIRLPNRVTIQVPINP
jgi:hypothetical protein